MLKRETLWVFFSNLIGTDKTHFYFVLDYLILQCAFLSRETCECTSIGLIFKSIKDYIVHMMQCAVKLLQEL